MCCSTRAATSSAARAWDLPRCGRCCPAKPPPATSRGGLPHFPAKAKRVIYLFQSGAPSQMDLFDYKPKLNDLRGTELPDSIRKGQRLTGMTSRQESFPVAPSKFRSPGTASAAPGSASCCRTPPGRR